MNYDTGVKCELVAAGTIDTNIFKHGAMIWKKLLVVAGFQFFVFNSKALSPIDSGTKVSKYVALDSNHTSKPCRSVVSFVNGIYHSYSESQKIASQLEEIFDEEVRVFYNPSTGNWFSDAYRAGVELIYKPDDLLIAKSLALHLRRALKDVGTEGNYSSAIDQRFCREVKKSPN